MAKAPTTTTYTWPNDSLVRRIDVREQSDGRAVAYLYADESETARPQRQEVRARLRMKGWGTLSDYRDGAYALRISGIENGSELIELLKNNGFISASPTVTNNSGTQQENGGVVQSIKSNSLRASALGYLLGDSLYFKGANNRFDKGMALSFGFGDAMLAAFGGKDENRQYKTLLTGLRSHMERNGIEIPKNASVFVEIKEPQQGIIGSVSSFFHKHINTIKIMSEVVGGAFVLRSGLAPETAGPRAGKNNPFNIASGLIIMGGWAGALLVKERKVTAEEKQNASGTERVKLHFEEKPLRLAGYAGLSFNTLRVTDNLVNARTTSKWNHGAVGAMAGANALYAMSTKSIGDIKTDAMVNDVYIVAAQILNKQPESLREAAIESTAKFLGERPEIKDTHAEVVTKLREQMSVQRESPWFEKTPLPTYTPQPKKPKIAIGREALALSEEASTTPQPAATIDTQGLQHAGTAVQKAAAVTQAAAL